MKFYLVWYIGNREYTQRKIAAENRTEAMRKFSITNGGNENSLPYIQCRPWKSSDISPNF